MSYRGILLALAGAAALTAAVMVAGGYNVSASSGHLPPVRALLHWTMSNSVRVRSGGVVPPDLAARDKAMAGAGHYDLVCRDCHGAPGEPVGAVARHMVPAPPHILDAVKRWQPEDLFWIVKNGIKMTAMPAWPAPQRDDEVWAVVAFLLRLPDMSAGQYREMVMGPLRRKGERRADAPDLDGHLERCARCHGYDGHGIASRALPRLNGLTEEYLHGALAAFATGDRASGIMQAHASAVPDTHLRALARHYARAGAKARPRHQALTGDPRRIPPGTDAPWGKRVALEGVPARKVPACADCHGPAPYPRARQYPSLDGQPASYLQTQLRLFRQGRRGGSAFAGIMSEAARGLDDRDIQAVADYYAGLDPAPHPR